METSKHLSSIKDMEKEIIMKKDLLSFKSSSVLKMNLQLFGDGEDNPETPPAGQATEFNLDDLTDEQLASIREKHGFKTDDDVNEIVKGKHSRWLKDQQAKENRAKELSELSDEQREQAILQGEKDDFEKEKAEFRKEQLFVEKGKQLTLEGVPSSFANRIIGDSAEEILSDVKSFKKSWDEAIEVAVNERLKQSAFTPGGASGGTGNEKGSLGKRLAEANSANQTESKFF